MTLACSLLACGTSPKSNSTDGGSLSLSDGLTITQATNTTLNGKYALQLSSYPSNGGGNAFNGNFNNQVEMEVDTNAAGAVIEAHFWNYVGSGVAAVPDKTYGCDGGKTTVCTGVVIDVGAKTITLQTVTWPEVNQPHFDGSADTKTPGGATVTLAGILKVL